MLKLLSSFTGGSQVTIGLAFALLVSIGYGGYEHFSFKQYRTEVESLGKQAEIKNQEIAKQQAIATQGIENVYNTKIDAIRTTYLRLHDSSRSPMSTIPNTTIRIDDSTAIMVLAEQCSETTQQLISLQDWINLQVGISK